MSNIQNGLRKFSLDMILNIVSYSIPILILQFIVLPLLARFIDGNEYGLMLSLTGIISIAGEMSGGTLSNVRLIFDSNYKDKKIVGDYRLLFIQITMGIGLFVIIIFLFFYKISIIQLLLLLIYYVFFSYRSYLTVGYRLELKYSLVFINNLFLGLGYLIGLLISYLTYRWEFTYVIGLLVAVIHVYFTTRMRFEPMKKTELYDKVLKKTIFLMGAYLIGNSMNYFDRILLYPLIGALAVSQYYVATIFGKALNLLIAPINTVLLSYLSKKKKITNKEIIYIFLFLFLIGFVFVLISQFIAPLILQILYPDYVDTVLPIVPLATCSTVLMACTTLFKTLSMRYVSEKLIFFTEVIYIVSYFILSVFFMNQNGLMGFCFAVVISAMLRLILFLLGLLFCKKNFEEEF